MGQQSAVQVYSLLASMRYRIVAPVSNNGICATGLSIGNEKPTGIKVEHSHEMPGFIVQVTFAYFFI